MIHKLTLWLLMVMCLSGSGFVQAISLSQPPSIKGHIDNIIFENNTYYINGWACQVGDPQSIQVHVYLDGSYQDGGSFFKAAFADYTSEPQVSTACQTTGVNHRFRIPIHYDELKVDASREIHVNAISKQSNINPPIGGSGQQLIPSEVDLSYVLANDSSLNLTIPHTLTVRIDADLNHEILTIKGALVCAYTGDYDFSVEGILVSGAHAIFECGTALNPFMGNLDITFTGNNIILDGHSDFGKEFIVKNAGTLRFYGKPGKSGIFQLKQTANANTWQLHIDGLLTDWQIDDEIVVTSTTFDPHQAEKLTIKTIHYDSTNNTTIITTRQMIRNRHWGTLQHFSDGNGSSWALDERAEVVNLTRNIKILSADDISAPDNANIGTHLMIMEHGSSAQIDHVEFNRVGQMGEMGRYPFHWHRKGIVEGQFISNSSIHESFNRCIVLHGTHKARVENNICYNHFGHGYFLEDGNERKNEIIGNIGILSKIVPVEKSILDSESNPNLNPGRFPAPGTFWISNPDNKVMHNIAAGSEGTGFWMAFHKEIKCQLQTDCPSTPEFQPWLAPVETNTWKFENNKAHSSMVGMTHDGGPNGAQIENSHEGDRMVVPTHYAPGSEPKFSNLVAYKNFATGIYYRGDGAVYKDTILADNAASVFFAYDQELRDSLIVGFSDNVSYEDIEYVKNSRTWGVELPDMFVGALIYDGPFFLNNVHFANFSADPLIHVNGGQQIEYTPTAFKLMGGEARYTNIVNGLSFNPEPLNKVDMSLSHSRNRLWSDAYSARIIDQDGSLSGVPNAEIRPMHALNFENTCSSISDWNAYTCINESSHLRFMKRFDADPGSGVEIALNRENMSFTLQKNADFIYSVADFPNYNPDEPNRYNKLPMILDGSSTYHIGDFLYRDEDEWVEVYFTANADEQSSNIISMSFKDTLLTCSVFDEKNPVNGQALPEFNTVNQLLNSPNHGLVRNGTQLYLKLKTDEPWFTGVWAGLYSIECQ